MTRLLSALGLVFLASGLCAAEPRPTPPNLVLILSDDQSWSGTGVCMDPELAASSDTRLRTPNLERLAAEGMRFTRAYAPSSVCSPTRASLQTGMGPAALRWTRAGPAAVAADGHPLVPPRSERNLAAEYVTIGELLQGAGYTTAHLGKWHLAGGGPEAHGYAVSDGNTENRDAADFPADNPDDVFGMSRRAAAFMARAHGEGKPFFVQLSCYALHYPESALPGTVEHYRKTMPRSPDRQVFRAAITEDLDTGIGLLLDAIEQLKLSDTTYVIYMSDNGGGGGGGGRGGGPGRNRRGGRSLLRGGKGNLYEGGIRVPFIVRGPGVPANSVCRVPIHGTDLLPTFAAWAGASDQVAEAVEGGDIRHLLRGETTPVRRSRAGLFFHFPHYQTGSPQAAVIDGESKLVYDFEGERSVLFDLDTDPGETNDVAASQPERAAALEKRLLAWLQAVDAKLPAKNPQADPAKAEAARARERGGRRRR